MIKSGTARGTRSWKRAIMDTAVVLAFLGLGAAVYMPLECADGQRAADCEQWSAVDTVYFCTATLATIGQPFLLPSLPGTRVFTVLFIAAGVCFVWPLLVRLFADALCAVRLCVTKLVRPATFRPHAAPCHPRGGSHTVAGRLAAACSLHLPPARSLLHAAARVGACLSWLAGGCAGTASAAHARRARSGRSSAQVGACGRRARRRCAHTPTPTVPPLPPQHTSPARQWVHAGRARLRSYTGAPWSGRFDRVRLEGASARRPGCKPCATLAQGQTWGLHKSQGGLLPSIQGRVRPCVLQGGFGG